MSEPTSPVVGTLHPEADLPEQGLQVEGVGTACGGSGAPAGAAASASSAPARGVGAVHLARARRRRTGHPG